MTDNKVNENKIEEKEKSPNENEDNEKIEDENKRPSDSIYNNQAEIISHLIIEKIISLSVTKINCNELYKNIGNYCFDFIEKKVMKPCLKSLYIPFEIEEDTNKDKILFFDSVQPNKENTWIEIIEPNTPFIDRCSHGRMKFTPIEIPETDINEDENLNENEEDKDKRVTYVEKKDDENIKKEEEEKKKKAEEKKKKDKRKKEEKEKKLKEENEKKLKEENEKKEQRKPNENDGKDGPWIDLPSYDLPKELFISEIPEINELRRDMELEKNRKIKQKLLEEEEKRREKQKEMQSRIGREFDTKRLTFDSNGNIINLKLRNNVESNLGNEFYWSRPFVKDGKTFRHMFLRQPRKSFQSKNPNILKDDKNKNNKDNKIEEVENENENENENDDEKNDKKNKKRNSFSQVKKSAVTILGEDVIRNTNNLDVKYFLRFMKQKESQYKDLSQPSGQNFDKIIPEVGVNIISEKKEKKEGGLDFAKKFNKPSMEEFSKLAFDTESLNSQKLLSSNLIFSNNKLSSSNSISNTNSKNNITDININNNDNQNNVENYIGYSKQFNSIDNPLIQNAHKIINNTLNDESIQNSQLSSISNSLQHYSYVGNSFRTKLLSNEMTLGKKNSNSNLKSYFYEKEDDNNNSYVYSNQNYKSIKPTGSNFINNKLSKKGKIIPNIKITNEVMIDKFNSNIVKNKNWGSDNGNLKPDSNSYIRPHKSNHIRELGYRIVSTKLPRDRKFVESPDPFEQRRAQFVSLSQERIKSKIN